MRELELMKKNICGDIINSQSLPKDKTLRRWIQMGIANIGIPSLILIIILALIIFGPKKLPEIGKAAGQTLKEFKTATNDLIINDENDKPDKKEN